MNNGTSNSNKKGEFWKYQKFYDILTAIKKEKLENIKSFMISEYLSLLWAQEKVISSLGKNCFTA